MQVASISSVSRTKRLLRLALTFVTGQTSIQVINLLTGFLLIRWMSLASYAQYSVTNSFQATIGLIIDIGFTQSIVSLVGNQGTRPKIVGSYIKCARVLRGRMFFLIGLVSLVMFPLVVARQPWSAGVKATLLGAILASEFFDAWLVYRAPLLIHKRLKASFRADGYPAIIRLAVAGLIYLMGGLCGWVATWLSTFVVAGTGLMLKHAARELISEPSTHDTIHAKEMTALLAPNWPSTVVFALQGQISIALITYFGQTHNIAEVAALGRINQFWMFLGAANVLLVGPRVAGTESGEVGKQYRFVFGASCLLAVPLVVLGFAWHRPLLWILGSGYKQVGPLLGITILSGAIMYLTGTLSTMNNARKWVFWLSSGTSTILMILMPVAYVFLGDVSTTKGMVVYGLVGALVQLIGTLFVTWLGFRQLRRNASG